MSQPITRIVTWIAVVLGVGELLDSLDISFWEGALAFGVLFLAGALWTQRGSIGGPILVGLLCAFEVQAFFQWPRVGTQGRARNAPGAPASRAGRGVISRRGGRHRAGLRAGDVRARERPSVA